MPKTDTNISPTTHTTAPIPDQLTSLPSFSAFALLPLPASPTLPYPTKQLLAQLHTAQFPPEHLARFNSYAAVFLPAHYPFLAWLKKVAELPGEVFNTVHHLVADVVGVVLFPSLSSTSSTGVASSAAESESGALSSMTTLFPLSTPLASTSASASTNHTIKSALPLIATIVSRSMLAEAVPTLRPLHPIFLTACLTTNQYSLALPLISVQKKSFSAISYRDNLMYHFQAAILNCAHLEWAQAITNFELVITAPGKEISAFQIEAYKSLILVQLIYFDQIKLPLTGIHPNFVKLTKNAIGPYLKFAAAYVDDSLEISDVADALDKIKDQLASSKQLSLAQYVLSLLPQKRIRRLAAVYNTIAIKDITSAAKLPVAFSTGKILVLISKLAPFVSVSGENENSIIHLCQSAPITSTQLSASVAKAKDLAEYADCVNTEISTSSKWQALENEELKNSEALASLMLPAPLDHSAIVRSFQDNY